MRKLEMRLEEFGLDIINEEVTKEVTLEDFEREFGHLDLSKSIENEYGQQDLDIDMIDENDDDYCIMIEYNEKQVITHVYDRN